MSRFEDHARSVVRSRNRSIDLFRDKANKLRAENMQLRKEVKHLKEVIERIKPMPTL